MRGAGCRFRRERREVVAAERTELTSDDVPPAPSPGISNGVQCSTCRTRVGAPSHNVDALSMAANCRFSDQRKLWSRIFRHNAVVVHIAPPFVYLLDFRHCSIVEFEDGPEKSGLLTVTSDRGL